MMIDITCTRKYHRSICQSIRSEPYSLKKLSNREEKMNLKENGGEREYKGLGAEM